MTGYDILPNPSSYRVAKEITKGMSGEKKFYLETAQGEFAFMQRLNRAGVPMPKAI